MPSRADALELDSTSRIAYTALADVQRKQSKWAELNRYAARALGGRDRPEAQDRLAARLGDLCESQLSSTAKAIEAYQQPPIYPAKTASRPTTHSPRSSGCTAVKERWASLAKVLDARPRSASLRR